MTWRLPQPLTDCPPLSQPALKPGCVAAFLGHLRRLKRRASADSSPQGTPGEGSFQEGTESSGLVLKTPNEILPPPGSPHPRSGFTSQAWESLSPSRAISNNTPATSQFELCSPTHWSSLPPRPQACEGAAVLAMSQPHRCRNQGTEGKLFA